MSQRRYLLSPSVLQQYQHLPSFRAIQDDCQVITARLAQQLRQRSLEGMMLKLKLQYFGHLMQRVDSLEKTLMLGGRRTRGQPRMRWLDGIIDSMYMRLTEFRELAMDREAWHAEIHGVAKSRTRMPSGCEGKLGVALESLQGRHVSGTL